MSNSDSLAISSADLVYIEILGEARNGTPTKVALHEPDAVFAEIPDDATMSVVFLLAVEVKPLIN